MIPHTQDAPNHVLHLLLTLFTAGIWLVIWLLVALGGGKGQATCTKCGNRRAPDGVATISAAAQPVAPPSARTVAIVWITVLVAIAAIVTYGIVSAR